MTHEEIKILISAYFDGEVSPSEKNIAEEHLRACASCQKDFQMYKTMSSSLSKWSDEALSPDETIKMQKRFEQRREPMFTKRTATILTMTIAVTIVIGSMVHKQVQNGFVHDATIYNPLNRGIQGSLKSAADNIGDQYAEKAQNVPYYLQNNLNVNTKSTENKRLAQGLVAADALSERSRTGFQSTQYQPYYSVNNSTAVLGSPSPQAIPFAANTPVFFKKDYISYAKSDINNDHKVIKNANITLKVKNAQNTQEQLDRLVTKFDGIIINFQIDKMTDESRKGLLVFNVLPKNLKDVLIEIRKLGEVVSENQAGLDITNQYEYLKAKLENYVSDRDRFQKLLVKNVNNVDSNLYIQNQIDRAQARINSLNRNIKLLDDQSYMATVVVNFYDTPQPAVIKVVSFKDKIITDFKNNLKITLKTSYDIGINSFNGLFIVFTFLFQVLLWSLIIWGLYFLIRKVFKQ